MWSSWKSLLVGMVMASVAAPVGALEVGDQAPDFSLPGSDGETHRLSDYRGQAVVVAWFPKAYTSGCTIECKSLAENGDNIRAFDVTYFMASVDPLEQNKGFAAETGADFPLLSDEDKSVAKAYGVLPSGGYSTRHTISIDNDSQLSKVDTQNNPETSAAHKIAN